MKYFNIDKESGRVLSVSDSIQNVPDSIFIRETKPGEVDLFLSGPIFHDRSTDNLSKALITDAQNLREQMIIHGTKILNSLAKSKGYLDLADAISFTNSSVKSNKIDAEKAIKLRDQLRSDISIFIDSLTKDFAISLEEAMTHISPLNW